MVMHALLICCSTSWNCCIVRAVGSWLILMSRWHKSVNFLINEQISVKLLGTLSVVAIGVLMTDVGVSFCCCFLSVILIEEERIVLVRRYEY
jgi:hypothetical protein